MKKLVLIVMAVAFIPAGVFAQSKKVLSKNVTILNDSITKLNTQMFSMEQVNNELNAALERQKQESAEEIVKLQKQIEQLQKNNNEVNSEVEDLTKQLKPYIDAENAAKERQEKARLKALAAAKIQKEREHREKKLQDIMLQLANSTRCPARYYNSNGDFQRVTLNHIVNLHDVFDDFVAGIKENCGECDTRNILQYVSNIDIGGKNFSYAPVDQDEKIISYRVFMDLRCKNGKEFKEITVGWVPFSE